MKILHMKTAQCTFCLNHSKGHNGEYRKTDKRNIPESGMTAGIAGRRLADLDLYGLFRGKYHSYLRGAEK